MPDSVPKSPSLWRHPDHEGRKKDGRTTADIQPFETPEAVGVGHGEPAEAGPSRRPNMIGGAACNSSRARDTPRQKARSPASGSLGPRGRWSSAATRDAMTTDDAATAEFAVTIDGHPVTTDCAAPSDFAAPADAAAMAHGPATSDRATDGARR